jgi:hypothetical protein
MTLTEIITAIASGDADENLTAVYEAYKERSRLLRSQRGTINRLTITPGTRVRLTNIKPNYLIGREGVVVTARTSSTRIAVEFDPSIPGWGNPVMVPATAVERA